MGLGSEVNHHDSDVAIEFVDQVDLKISEEVMAMSGQVGSQEYQPPCPGYRTVLLGYVGSAKLGPPILCVQPRHPFSFEAFSLRKFCVFGVQSPLPIRDQHKI